MKKILNISYSDSSGGASRAAYRIHKCINDSPKNNKFYSKLLVNKKETNDNSVLVVNKNIFQKATYNYKRLSNKILSLRYQKLANKQHISTASQKNYLYKNYLFQFNSKPDIINIHWIDNSTISIEEIPKINSNIILTLHDQWPFSGAKHYNFYDNNIEPFTKKFKRYQNKFINSILDVDSHTWWRKENSWKGCNWHVICPSKWMADCAKKSFLLKDMKISVIPHPIDLDKWKNIDRREARKKIGLSLNKIYLLFGAELSTKEPRKGVDIFLDSLKEIKNNCDSNSKEIEILIFGEANKNAITSCPFKIKFLGHIKNDAYLNNVYSASDLFVLSSRIDNLPLTGMEAQASGTPVVTFNFSGLPELIENKVTGSLAMPFNQKSLANEIMWSIREDKNKELSINSRLRAEKIWD